MTNDFMSIHPRNSMLSTESPSVDPGVKLTDQASLLLHRWLWHTPEREYVIEPY